MLELKDFWHLPQVDDLMEQLAADRGGLTIVAGLDSRPVSAPASSFLPSGRSAFFGVLVRHVFASTRPGRVVLVAPDKDAIRLPDSLRRKTTLLIARSPEEYTAQIASVDQTAETLVVDHLTPQTMTDALMAAQKGIRVLSQFDCVLAGPSVPRYLLDTGTDPKLLDWLSWVVTVQRQPALCGHCKRPVEIDPTIHAGLRRDYPAVPLDGAFLSAPGCPHCNGTGRAGDVAVFDFFRASAAPPPVVDQRSLLSMQEYILRLALLGQVPLDDLLHFDGDQLHRTFRLLASSESALATANADLNQKLAQLEAANRVLRQRTESLVSLQEIAGSLIGSTSLAGLAREISRHARELCGADRSVLYVLQPDTTAEVLSVSGWDPALIGTRLDTIAVTGSCGPGQDSQLGEAAPFAGWPPGIPERHRDVEGAELKAGLRVPLITQHEVVGLMVVHSTRKKSFTAAEVALLQAFANQAAVAIQRTALIESLRDKIVQLEAAQAKLVENERLERELELARQVQQSLLPRVFPQVPGYRFAARCESARRVGGDFYDVFPLDRGLFGVVIADVSDKGMPAALYMALTRSLLLAEARREPSPARTLASVDRLLLELGDPNMFVTIFYGVLDPASQRLIYTRAGHEEPFLLRDGTVKVLSGQGRFLGLLDAESLSLSEESVVLKPGDRLVLYTDGLADALDDGEQAFGLERLQAFLSHRARLDAEDLCAATFAELEAYRGNTEQYDDMTMLVIAAE